MMRVGIPNMEGRWGMVVMANRSPKNEKSPSLAISVFLALSDSGRLLPQERIKARAQARTGMAALIGAAGTVGLGTSFLKKMATVPAETTRIPTDTGKMGTVVAI